MSASTGSLRTIWIEIRAMNYTMNVFTDVLRQISALQQSEMACAIASLNMAKAAMSSGLLFSVLAQQIGGFGGKVLTMVSYLMYATAGFKMLSAVIEILESGQLQYLAIDTETLVMTWADLAMVIGVATAGFTLIMFVCQQFGPLAGLAVSLTMAIIGLALAWSFLSAVVSGGATLALTATSAAGVAAIGAGIAGAIYSMTQYATGTRMVPETGPALVHRGEVIYNPSTGRPTQVANDLVGGNGGTSYSEMRVQIDTVNTKSDFDDVDQKLRKINRTVAQNRR